MAKPTTFNSELVALRPAGTSKGRTLWTCKCDCGAVTVAQTVRLRNGGTRSCGCLRVPSPKATADIAGQRFGRLVAVKQVDQTEGHAWIWECDCDCGGWTEATVGQLRRGQRTCCGQRTCPLARRPKQQMGATP